jgi:hypothetical protein
MTRTRKNTVDPLPNTLSGLIFVGLKDLEKAERSPRYKVDMGKWHEPSDTGKFCSVCFAGAVMAGTLGASPLANMEKDAFWDGIEDKLEALDDLRTGFVSDAAGCLYRIGVITIGTRERAHEFEFGSDTATQNPLCIIPDYTPRTRAKFHAAMKKLADALKKANL